MKLDDPIPSVIEDKGQVKTIFDNKTGIIPYAGTNNSSGDNLRKLLKITNKLSPTHKGCIKGKCDMGFSGYLQLWRNGLFDKGKQVEGPESNLYQEAFMGIDFVAPDYMTFLRAIGTEFLAYGNSFIEVYLYTVGKDVKCRIKKLPFDLSYIIKNDKNDQLYYLLTNHVDAIEQKGEITPLFPIFKEHELGYKAVLQIKNGVGIYGECDALDCVQNQYSEFQNMSYLLGMTDNNFTIKLIMEYEGSNPEYPGMQVVGGDNTDEEENTNNNTPGDAFDRFTQEGGGDQLFMTERPYGAKQMFVKEIKGNTDITYYKGLDDINATKIIRSHRWSHRLLGDNVSAGMNSEVYRQEWIDKYDTVVTAFVQSVLRPLDKVYDVFFEFSGKKELKGINQFVKNPLEDVFRSMGSTSVQ